MKAVAAMATAAAVMAEVAMAAVTRAVAKELAAWLGRASVQSSQAAIYLKKQCTLTNV